MTHRAALFPRLALAGVLLLLLLVKVTASSRAEESGADRFDNAMTLTSDTDGAAMMFLASPPNVSWGDSVNLSWSAGDGDRCFASGGWEGRKSSRGSFISQPLQDDTNFVLSCSRGNQAFVHQIMVNVQPIPPVLEFQPIHDQVPVNGGTTLHWQAAGAEICRASGAWEGDLPTSGSYATGPLAAPTTYHLQCISKAGVALTTVMVETLQKGLSS